MSTTKKRRIARPLSSTQASAKRVAGEVVLLSDTGNKAAAKASAILSASLNLFESRVFADVSTKEIAAMAGVNPAMLYYYFDSKEELFTRTVEMTVQAALEHFHKLEASAKSPRDIISGWLETHIRQFDIIRKFVKMSLNYRSSGTQCPEIDAAISLFYDTEKRLLTSAIQTGIENSSCDVVEAEQIATLISTFLDGIMVRSIILSDVDFTREIARFNVFIHMRLNWRI